MAGTSSSSQTVSTLHDPTPDVAGRIRRSLRTLLEGWAVGSDLVEDALLVVEELVTNVVDHARTRFLLTVSLTGAVLRVAVRDCCDLRPRARRLDPQSARGRGMHLIAGLTAHWGCQPHAATPGVGSGKTVWAELTV